MVGSYRKARYGFLNLEHGCRFSGAITKINKYLEAFTETHTRAHHKFLDCSPYFVTEDDSRIDNALMPDSVLPNAAGGQPNQPASIFLLIHKAGFRA